VGKNGTRETEKNFSLGISNGIDGIRKVTGVEQMVIAQWILGNSPT